MRSPHHNERLTDADFARFGLLLREIERTRPDQTFTLVNLDPDQDLTMDEALDFVRKNFPPQETRQ
jgi:hypothetical protein